MKEIIKKENEERQRDMKDIEGFVKKENADRKRETQEISDKMGKEEEKREQRQHQVLYVAPTCILFIFIP